MEVPEITEGEKISRQDAKDAKEDKKKRNGMAGLPFSSL